MTAVALLGRLLPATSRPTARARHLVERNIIRTRRSWLIVVSGFAEPVFYLFSIGVGLGQLIGGVEGPGGEPVTYAAFIAPGLLAASAMNGAVFESFNIFFALKYDRVYDAVLATPVGPGDIAAGEIGWSLLRGVLYATGFLAVVTTMGLVRSWWAVLALPAAILIGFAFGAVGMAATTYMRSWTDFDLIQLVILPLFLFSATFYPATVYPEALRPLLLLSPLYHGVALVRALTLGVPTWASLGHVAVLAIIGVVGIGVAGRRIRGLLLR